LKLTVRAVVGRLTNNYKEQPTTAKRTTKGRIVDGTATARLQWKRFYRVNIWLKKNCAVVGRLTNNYTERPATTEGLFY
jgi:hypothetical protein